MNDSFRDMIAEGWLVIYMDDLLISSPDAATHEERTKRVLQRMTELDLHLKLEKCKFATDEVEYLGMIVKPGQLDGIAKWPTSAKVKDVRSFLGFANFYRRLIPDYSNVTRPLIDLTKKNLQWNLLQNNLSTTGLSRGLSFFFSLLDTKDPFGFTPLASSSSCHILATHLSSLAIGPSPPRRLAVPLPHTSLLSPSGLPLATTLSPFSLLCL